MSLIPKDMTPVYKATIAKGTSPTRWQRPIYVDLLPPCNNACPAGVNIQAWLELAQDGRYHEAWQKYMEENPFPGTHGRACYHPCESACNRQFLDQPIADPFAGPLSRRPRHRKRLDGAGQAADRPACPHHRRGSRRDSPCAYHLRRMGHDVEIRDAGAEPGRHDALRHSGVSLAARRAHERNRAHPRDGREDDAELSRRRRARGERGRPFRRGVSRRRCAGRRTISTFRRWTAAR